MIFAARERTRTSAPADLDWRRLGTEGAGVAQAIGFREGRRRGGEGREVGSDGGGEGGGGGGGGGGRRAHAATSKRVAATHPADPGGSAVTHGSGPHGFPALPILRMRCSGTIRVCLVLEASGP
jgi:hypothetical protein